MKTFKEILLEKGDKDAEHKKKAKKIAKAKANKHCSGNMTPSIVTNGSTVKVKCTPKDKSKSRQMKKVAKKMKHNVSLMRKKAKEAKATKKFRGE